MQHVLQRISLGAVLLFSSQLICAEDLHPVPQPAVTGNMLQSLALDAGRRGQLAESIAARNYRAASELLAEEAQRNPDSQRILLVLANVLFLDGQHLNCAIALKKAEELAPLDERARLLLSLSYVILGRLNWAQPEFERLARSNPTNALYSYWLARIAYRKMDIGAATAHAKKAIELDPSFMKAYDQLGLCREADGEMDSAIQAFEQAIHLNDKLAVRSPWPSLNLGTLLLRMHRLDDAEVRLRESVRIDARFPVAHYRLGQVLEKKQRDDEAIAELEKAATLDPTYPEPHYALARIYRRRGDAKARIELRTFQELRKADKQKGITRPN
jgi:tetratricopeptide (TPR) repeat protein